MYQQTPMVLLLELSSELILKIIELIRPDGYGTLELIDGSAFSDNFNRSLEIRLSIRLHYVCFERAHNRLGKLPRELRIKLLQ